MERLNFYKVDKNYITYLQNAEKEKRNFTRVPNHDYDSNDKFVCGIVLEINNCKYYAPVTSYKIQQKENILIKDRHGVVKSSIRFNYMFPVPDNCLKPVVFDEIEDEQYRNLLLIEYSFCIINEEKIKTKARRTHKKITDNLSPSLTLNGCDFRLLEEKCLEYKTEVEREVATTKDKTKNIKFKRWTSNINGIKKYRQ